MTDVNADLIAEAVLACPDVVAMSGGKFGEVATYLPGHRVKGVRMTDDEIELHIVARFGPPLPKVAARVRTAVAPLAGGRPVAVVVDDVAATEAAIDGLGGGHVAS